MTTLLVVGDSVPAGRGVDEPWPTRVADEHGLDLVVDAAGGRTLAACVDRVDATAGADLAVVHAGHNDAQLSGDDPRVTEADFERAARDLDARLSEAADDHAFLGLVPLLPLDRPGTVPFGDEQPARGFAYDDLLARTVETHLPVAGPEDVADWRAWTADGVHPGPEGHRRLAAVVGEWLDGAGLAPGWS